MRIVVVLGASDVEPWSMPAARFVDRVRIAGGERTMLEVATGAAALGHEVELRGDLSEPDVEDLRRAANVRFLLPSDPRRPTADDVVFVPEGYLEPEFFARVALSPARAIMLVLAVPGLFGPPLTPGFVQPDPLSVDPAAVGRPEDLRAIRDAGFELWTNSPAMVQIAADESVVCEFLGTGTPLAYPPPGPRTHDVAIVEANRWSPLTRRVVDTLDGQILTIPETDRSGVLAGLGAARIFVHPAVVEGQSRLQIEARAMGAVPIGLRSNRFAAGLTEGGGIVVDSLEEMAPEVRRLLASPQELSERSELAMRSAREQVDWQAFLDRLGKLLTAPPPPDPLRPTRAALGEAVEGILKGAGELRRHATNLEALTVSLRSAVAWLEGELERSERRGSDLTSEVAWLRGAVERLAEERDEARGIVASLRGRRAVRLADRMAFFRGWPTRRTGRDG